MQARKGQGEADAVYHYTAWATLPEIVHSGFLRPSAVGAENERPLLWFSSHQRWEPTATKLVIESGVMRQMSFQEMLVRFGAVRFALARNDERLMDWQSACAYAGTPETTALRLETVGRLRGANPCQWFAIADPLPSEAMAFSVFMGGKWRSARAREMADVWGEQR